MIELKLTTSHFTELLTKGYTLDMIYLLKLLNETNEAYPNSPKIDNIIQTLIRKGLITEKEEVTDEGKALIAFLSSTEDKPKIARKKREITVGAFDTWWKAYPPTDTFEYKGRKFKGTRALKTKKPDCKIKLDKILASGEYTVDELVGALELEVSQKMENSFKTGTNKMSYMQNSLTYLNQCTYEAFIELLRAGYKPAEQTKTSIAGGIQI